MRKLLLASVAVLSASVGFASLADAQTASPAPGTVTVRLNGRVRFYAYAAFDSDSQSGDGNKVANYGFADYARLYPGFDGVAANGLKYGASIEIRQDASAPAGGGTAGSVSGQDPKRGELYVRREWGYIGTDQLGTIRLGSTDQPTSLYMTGNFENFNDGGLNGDAPAFVSSNTAVSWPFSDGGSYYTTEKAVYLSPQLYGFDFGVSYEPSTANVSGSANCGVAAPGCDRLAATPVNGETSRRKDSVDALIRYRGTFGGFGIAATAAYLGGGHVRDNSGLPFTNSPTAVGGARYDYQGLNVGDFGVALTYAGFSVGGKYSVGRFNGGNYGLEPKGASGADAILVGASYTIGSVIVGAHALYYKSAGDVGNDSFNRQRVETGVAAGGTYSLAPGVSLFLSYLYNERRQNGYDFLSGAGVTAATGPAGTKTHNQVTSNLISIGTSFSW